MSVRVNLLPQLTRERDRALQQRNVLIGAATLLLVGLGALHVWGASGVDTARDELVAAQLMTTQLDGEVAEMAAFSDLARRQQESELAMQTALGDEVSVAGIFQDFALVMPTDAQFETLTIQLGFDEDLEDGVAPSRVGTFTATGRTLAAHAPGVERFLIEMDKISNFQALYLSSSVLDEPDDRVATFTFDGELGLTAQTGRYANGLPEEFR
jgi:hypothetical protein